MHACAKQSKNKYSFMKCTQCSSQQSIGEPTQPPAEVRLYVRSQVTGLTVCSFMIAFMWHRTKRQQNSVSSQKNGGLGLAAAWLVAASQNLGKVHLFTRPRTKLKVKIELGFFLRKFWVKVMKNKHIIITTLWASDGPKISWWKITENVIVGKERKLG